MQYQDLFTVIDSVNTALEIKYPDSSLSRNTLKSQIDSITDVVQSHHHDESGFLTSEIYIGLIIIIVGSVLLILGLIGSLAARYDLSSRAYEDRALDLRKMLGLAISRNLWMLIVQSFIIGFAMLFGFGMIIGLTFTISPVLGAFGILASFAIIIYTIVRILFSQIALVSEESGPFNAIVRSLDLTKNSFLRIFGIFLIATLLMIIASTILQLPFSYIFTPKTDWLITFFRGKPIDIPKTVDDIKSSIYGWEFISVISGLLTASFSTSFITTFYYDLRTRREGVLEYSSLPSIDSNSNQISQD